MGYVVQAEGAGNDAASVTVQNQHEALELAVRWRDDGHAGVRIIGGGRVFMTPEDFAAAINNEACQAPLMDRERKTLAEFSRTYLQSLETPVNAKATCDGGDAERRFAACVALGMERADQERHER